MTLNSSALYQMKRSSYADVVSDIIRICFILDSDFGGLNNQFTCVPFVIFPIHLCSASCLIFNSLSFLFFVFCFFDFEMKST